MADLTLNEYRDIPEDELQKIFQAETKKMFGIQSRGRHRKTRNQSDFLIQIKKALPLVEPTTSKPQ
ncbi:MAG: hypothetical protein JW932_15035 [Deltaproteobacteria bacterium]|nr:hypothetical protein [Deltaproteobacteria bacterium]